MKLTTPQECVIEKMRSGLRLWAGDLRKWGLERPIMRDLQPEETYKVAEGTALALRRRGLIEPDGTRSSLRGVSFYRLTPEKRSEIARKAGKASAEKRWGKKSV